MIDNLKNFPEGDLQKVILRVFRALEGSVLLPNILNNNFEDEVHLGAELGQFRVGILENNEAVLLNYQMDKVNLVNLQVVCSHLI